MMAEKEFDPKDFSGKVSLEKAQQMGYSFEQLCDLVDQGELHSGAYMVAGSTQVHHEYSTNPDKVWKPCGEVRI